MVARRVCCRASAVRLPPVSRRKRWSRRSARPLSDSQRSRAAASSMASGSPSSRAQIDTTSGAVCSSNDRPVPCALARSRNSATASEDSAAEDPQSPGPGSDSGGTR
jgi:hypothetical protein